MYDFKHFKIVESTALNNISLMSNTGWKKLEKEYNLIVGQKEIATIKSEDLQAFLFAIDALLHDVVEDIAQQILDELPSSDTPVSTPATDLQAENITENTPHF